MKQPPIATMYALRDGMIASLPHHALFGRVPGERDAFLLTVLVPNRERDITVRASQDGESLKATATVAPYGRVLTAAGTDVAQVAHELAAAIVALLQSSTQEVNVTFKQGKKRP